jgi:hypothetical protein
MIQNQNLSLRDLFKALRFLWVAIVFMAVALALEPIAHKKNQVRISPEKTERDLHRKIDRLDKRCWRSGNWLRRLDGLAPWKKMRISSTGLCWLMMAWLFSATE